MKYSPTFSFSLSRFYNPTGQRISDQGSDVYQNEFGFNSKGAHIYPLYAI